METSLLIGGFGGQGVQTLGKLIAYAANEDEKNVTFSPAYGGEMRGGTSNCTVVVSDRYISSPNKQHCDLITAMNADSFRTFEKQVKPGGLLIVNDSLVDEQSTRTDIRVVRAPFSEEAAKLGSEKVLNVVVMGFLVAYTGIVSMQAAERVVLQKLGKKEQFRVLNAQAFQAGAELAQKALEAQA